ncbi:hypothetical protein ACQEWB_16800 [Streptomyces sp. CA-249302]|uniref:hypothetical protein n=1 Tax=Streptomyces sp. CA-249302 TaxID=3240058 RepID=UPI003D8D3BBB
MAESSGLLATALREHQLFYQSLSKHLPELEGEVIAAAHEAIRELATAAAVPCAAYEPVIEAVASAVEYCEFTGHPEGARYYAYWHVLLLADQALCASV